MLPPGTGKSSEGRCGGPTHSWRTLTLWWRSSETQFQDPRLSSKSTRGWTRSLPAVCKLHIFFPVPVRSITLSQFCRKAFPDSRVTAFINYCISCFTYPNYLPTAQTMAFFKTFFSLLFLVKIENMNMYGFLNLFQKTQHKRHLLAKLRNVNIDSHSLD